MLCQAKPHLINPGQKKPTERHTQKSRLATLKVAFDNIESAPNQTQNKTQNTNRKTLIDKTQKTRQKNGPGEIWTLDL